LYDSIRIGRQEREVVLDAVVPPDVVDELISMIR
jgi:hypothetical protein